MRRRVIILVILSFVLASLLFGVFFFLRSFNEDKVTETPSSQSQGQDKTPAANLPADQPVFEDGVPAPVTSSEQNTQAPADARTTVSRLAASFTERFGSFSTESNFENMLDLKPVMSRSLAAWVDGYVAEKRREARGGEPYGVTTRALSVKFTVFSESSGKADVVVVTQRHSTGQGERVYYQNLLLTFMIENGLWKADDIRWEKEERSSPAS